MQGEIKKLSRVVNLFRRELNKDLPSQHIAMLLTVAMQPGITMPELCKELDMPQGTVSRNVKLLSAGASRNGSDSARKGYGLLETDQASTNRYQLSVFLTSKGERLMEQVAELMGEAVGGNESSQRRKDGIVTHGAAVG